MGIQRLAVTGHSGTCHSGTSHSGGGPHALACGALLRDRVLPVVSVAGLAPFGAKGLDWFEGMSDSGKASLHAAAVAPCA